MELPDDILSCHRIILDLLSVVERVKAQQAGYIQLTELQRTQLEMLTKRIAELESQVHQNSQNSSQPPSKDLYKPNPKPAFPRAKGGKIGGKAGHTGGTLHLVDTPDLIAQHTPAVCVHCGQVHGMEPKVLRARRQVFDIPPPRLEVTEHQVFDWVCSSCQTPNRGEFPPGICANTQYGFRLVAMSALFNNGYNIARNKVQSIFNDLYGVRLNEGTLQAQNELTYACLEGEEAHIKTKLLQSEVAHLDETGVYVAGKRYWLHVASNGSYTHLFVHPHRGAAAHEPGLSILSEFRNRAIHDCWATYFLFPDCKHGTCGSHFLREFIGLTESGSKWATAFHAFLLELYERSDKGNADIPTEQRPEIRIRYQKLLDQADLEEPPPTQKARGKPKKTKGRNLFDRLSKHQEAALAFAFNKNVPFTNNQAERDIRPTKTKMKVSGCFRTPYGAEIYARIQGFISTVRKLQFNPFKELYAVLAGDMPEYRLKSC